MTPFMISGTPRASSRVIAREIAKARLWLEHEVASALGKRWAWRVVEGDEEVIEEVQRIARADLPIDIDIVSRGAGRDFLVNPAEDDVHHVGDGETAIGIGVPAEEAWTARDVTEEANGAGEETVPLGATVILLER